VKLLYINHNVVGTGTFLRAIHLARAMVRRGHEVTLLTTSRDRRLVFAQREEDGVRLVESPDLWWGAARTGWDPWNALRRWLHVRSDTFDLVHAFDGRPVVSVPAWLLTWRSVPLVMDWADWWGRGGQLQQRSGRVVRTFFGPVETWFEEVLRPGAAAHTVISSALAGRAAGLGADPLRVLVLPNGCAPEAVHCWERAAARAVLGAAAAEPLVVHLGTTTALDMALLADAIRLLRERLPAARLVLVGRPAVLPPRDLLDAGTARVTGRVPDDVKDRWLGAADVCVIALADTIGNRGRWPSRINDYLSAGRATVMTDVGDAAALVRREGVGVVAAPNAPALAAALERALRDRASADEAGARGRQLARGALGWSALAATVEGLYLAALAGRHAAGR
jgi:glycosyltransferase involved in cell wall biosynthesis